jgi:predicted RNase H-like HicB family nuclease
MEWKLECSIWREGEAFVARCDSLEISSHGKTVEDALGNLEEALELYLQHAPPAEIISYLSRLAPESRPFVQKPPEIESEHLSDLAAGDLSQAKGQISVAYA